MQCRDESQRAKSQNFNQAVMPWLPKQICHAVLDASEEEGASPGLRSLTTAMSGSRR